LVIAAPIIICCTILDERAFLKAKRRQVILQQKDVVKTYTICALIWFLVLFILINIANASSGSLLLYADSGTFTFETLVMLFFVLPLSITCALVVPLFGITSLVWRKLRKPNR
jgi:hypothetical protein